MKVVIDTNVVISAILRDRDPETIIRFVVQELDWDWYASRDILAEYIEVLHRPKFALPANIIQDWVVLLNQIVNVVDETVSIDFPRDQKDAKFLSCALTVDAHYFITGDRDFTEASKVVNTTICSVRQFKQLIVDTQF